MRIANTFRSASLLIVATVLLSIHGASPSVASAYVLKHTTAGAEVRWYARSVKLRIDPALEAMLPDGQVKAAAAMASDAWRGIGNAPDIEIEDGTPAAYDPDRRNDAIYLVKDWPFEPTQLAVTVLTYSSTGQILGMDVLVNGNKRFALLPEGDDLVTTDAHDLGAVLTHEFGHVLGLDESRDAPSATMYPYIRNGEVHQRSLSNDDEQAVVEAYQAQAVDVAAAAGACSVSANIGSNGHAGLSGLAALALAALAVLRRRAR